jgi:hypothetical protein
MGTKAALRAGTMLEDLMEAILVPPKYGPGGAYAQSVRMLGEVAENGGRQTICAPY